MEGWRAERLKEVRGVRIINGRTHTPVDFVSRRIGTLTYAPAIRRGNEFDARRGTLSKRYRLEGSVSYWDYEQEAQISASFIEYM